jgi:metal-responsive CopG/Arc/MetJ family transcriptional regulator
MLPSDYKLAISISISPDLLGEIDTACEIVGCKRRSTFIHEALEIYLKHFNMQLEKLEINEEALTA